MFSEIWLGLWVPQSRLAWQCYPLKKMGIFYYLNMQCIISLVRFVLELSFVVTLRYLHKWRRMRAMISFHSYPNLS